MPYTYADLIRITHRLTGGERTEILRRFCEANPHYRGAKVEDALDLLDMHDAGLAELEPFFEAHQELKRYAGYWVAGLALLWSGQDLTPEAITRLCEVEPTDQCRLCGRATKRRIADIPVCTDCVADAIAGDPGEANDAERDLIRRYGTPEQKRAWGITTDV